MALTYKDRVKQDCIAPSGENAFDFTVGGSTPTGFQSFASALSDADTTVYGSFDVVGGWEIGLGTWDEDTSTLARTTVYTSSNNGSHVSFSGIVSVFITFSSAQLITTPNWRDVDWSGFKLQNVTLQQYNEVSSSPTISSGAITFDLTNGNIFLVSLNSDITSITITGAATSPKCSSFTVHFTADGTQRNITWPSSVTFAYNVTPQMTSTSGKKDVLTFNSVDSGTTWLGFVAGQGF